MVLGFELVLEPAWFFWFPGESTRNSLLAQFIDAQTAKKKVFKTAVIGSHDMSFYSFFNYSLFFFLSVTTVTPL